MASDSHAHAAPSSLFHDQLSPPCRRLSLRHPPQLDLPQDPPDRPHESPRREHEHRDLPRSRHHIGACEADKLADDKDESISISSTSKQAVKTVRPFLAQHIPQQYNPLGNQPQPRRMNGSNTKYCYRHRPDIKCRRQANEPSMEQLQEELGTLSQSDQQGIAHVWSLFSAAPSKHRNLMLQGILAQCCFPQLSFISAAVRDLIKIDFLSALPPELGFKILCYLDTISLCKAAQVSRRWRQLADDDVVWHKMCEQHIDRKCTKCGWGLPLLEAKRLRTEKRQMQLRATGRGMNEWSPNITPLPVEREENGEASARPGGLKRRISAQPSSPEASSKRPCTQGPSSADQDSYFEPRTKRPWKDVYKDRFKVGTNWKYGRCTTKILRGHTNGIMCLQFDDSIIATGSYDATIKIWDIETGNELRTLTGHTNGIRCLQFDESRLFSGGLDRTIKLWNWKTGELLRTFPGHTGAIVSLHFAANILATGSMDHTIRVWNFPDKATFNLRGHTDWVNAVKIDGPSRTIFSASDDCTVRLWDIDTKRCLKVYKGHVGQVQQVLPMAPEFELDDDEPDPHSDHDHDHDPETPETERDPSESNILRYFNGPITPPRSTEEERPFYADQPHRPQPPRYMVTGALDGTIRLWSVSTGRCLRTFFGHVEGVWAIAADTLRLVSGAEDRMVKVWDPRTGRCDRTFTGHAGPVTCVGLSDSRLVSAGEDCEVRVMSFGCSANYAAGNTTSIATENSTSRESGESSASGAAASGSPQVEAEEEAEAEAEAEGS